MTRRPPRSLKRRFVTPEGVDLQLELGSVGSRAAAFLLDLIIMLLVLVAGTIVLALLFKGGGGQWLAILWLLGAFTLRNGWFILFELGGRGATPGKRVVGLRVIARDGARLMGSAVVARNAMREVEVFLPLTFLGVQAAENTADMFMTIFVFGWSAIFLFFPLFNRDRLRMGDIIAGTWVVRDERQRLGADLAAAAPTRRFSDAALDLYGEFELQALEDVLRGGKEESVATVAATIRAKAGLPEERDDLRFLTDYYGELCARLERRMALGRRVADKFQRPASPTRRFPSAALDLYSEAELQTLEDVLRAGYPESIATVAATIRAKAGLPDEGDDRGFLTDYHAAARARLERRTPVGYRAAG